MDFDLLHILLGYFTVLRFLDEAITFSTLVGTALFIHVLDGIACGLIAKKSKHSAGLWIIGGLLFGVWALISILFLVIYGEEKPAGTE